MPDDKPAPYGGYEKYENDCPDTDPTKSYPPGFIEELFARLTRAAYGDRPNELADRGIEKPPRKA
jgi:hypothetical protein